MASIWQSEPMALPGYVKLIAAMVLLGISASMVHADQGICPEYEMSFFTMEGQSVTTFDVALAATEEARRRGLMGVTDMPPEQGMLFAFDRPGKVGFWMKDTLIPLDMIFISSQGKVTSIHENAIPHDETTITSKGPVRYVLEVKAGQSRASGLSTGMTARVQRGAFSCSTRD